MKAEETEETSKKLSVKQYLLKIIPCLRDMINGHGTARNRSRVWKIQISMLINFISSKDIGEILTIYVWSDNKNIMWGSETDDIFTERFESFLNNYQKELEIIIAGDFKYESADLLDYQFHKVSLKRGRSYIK